MMDTEELLNRPYWIIDILPKRVPENAEGQYFAVEKYFRTALRDKLQLQKLSLMLKLNCYADLLLMFPESEESVKNPAPEKLSRILSEQEVLIFVGDALISSDPEDAYFTLYNPDERLLELITALAGSEGFFVWKGSEDPESRMPGQEETE